MAKTTALTAQTGAGVADADLFATVDLDDTTQDPTGTTKKISAAELGTAVGANGRTVLGELAAPSAPSAGARLYARKRAGRQLPAYVPASGLAQPVQPFLGTAMGQLVRGTFTSNLTSFGISGVTANGSAAAAATFSSGSALGMSHRTNYSSAATAGAAGGVREAAFRYFRGNGVAPGGFYYVTRLGFDAIPATRRWLAAMLNIAGTANSIGNVEPSTMTQVLGLGQDLADTTLQIMHNDGSGAATKVDTGIASPTTSEVIEFAMYSPSGQNNPVHFAVEKFSGAGVSSGVYEYTATTDLPTLTLHWQHWCNNGSTAAIMTLSFISLYIETDF